MKRHFFGAPLAVLLLLPFTTCGQETKQMADTLAIQADATYEADPDLATVVFDVTTQDKQLRKAYEQATSAMQRILQVAERNGLAKDDISTGRFTVQPFYDSSDRKLKARSYRVSGRITLRVRDFQRIGPLIDDSVQEGVTEFRELTYSLADEEAAKQQAVAQAMRRAEGRARAALGDSSRKLGPLRYANVDIRQIVPVARFGAIDYTTALMPERKELANPMPTLPSPEKVSVTASVQCVFQLQ
jgi:uncharacterized protein YggE